MNVIKPSESRLSLSLFPLLSLILSGCVIFFFQPQIQPQKLQIHIPSFANIAQIPLKGPLPPETKAVTYIQNWDEAGMKRYQFSFTGCCTNDYDQDSMSAFGVEGGVIKLVVLVRS